eukprot:scaffold285741_cov29-Tisochrysis_lutea.AAC.1
MSMSEVPVAGGSGRFEVCCCCIAVLGSPRQTLIALDPRPRGSRMLGRVSLSRLRPKARPFQPIL